MITSPDIAGRRELGEFIRSHRERLQPAMVGIEPGLRRRTPGLRREEVAQLAGVSATWLSWIEQGRDVSVSPAALMRLARVLRLTPAERAYLFGLSGKSDPEAPAESPSQEARADPAPMEVAKAPASGSETKIDHRWLAESLWRRVAELKRYPNSARMNGQEGKVILKAVIRSDGQLADVMVQKSSGHSVLDAAAIEAVKLACPLHMKHAIGKPQIVVSLPIVYSLAN